MGNICRSPMAEGILYHKLEKENLLDKVSVDSAGTGGWHVGQEPDGRGQACLLQKGIDISGQRARQFEDIDFQEFDRIFVMDESNYANIEGLAKSEEEREKIEFLLNLCPEIGTNSVPDPYYDNDGFEIVYNMIDQATEVLIEQIREAK